MRKAKLIVLLIFILSFSLTLMPSVSGQSKKGKKNTTPKSSKTPPKKANDDSLVLGAKVFDDNCAACHDSGGNSIEADKTLKLDALKTNGFNSVEDVKTRVIEGKGIMPVFKDELKPNELDAVSAYVWAKAQKDWQ